MIECVNLENNHFFQGNPLLAQHKLRYDSIIKRQKWKVPYVRDLEYDNYDNPAAYYLIKRDDAGTAVGVSRLISTTYPYMLSEHFSHLFTKTSPPKNDSIWETTRFCVELSLPHEERKRILQELVIGHLEFALERKIKNIIAVTYPALWKTIFIQSGWNVDWLGDVHKSDEGLKIIAGNLVVSQPVLNNVRKVTGIFEPIINYGSEPILKKFAA